MPDDNASDERHQDALFFSSQGFNELGEHSFSSYVEVKVRIEEEGSDVPSENSNLLETVLHINVDREMNIGDILWIGTWSGSNPTNDLLKVVNYEEIPDIKEKLFDRWVTVELSSDRLVTS